MVKPGLLESLTEMDFRVSSPDSQCSAEEQEDWSAGSGPGKEI